MASFTITPPVDCEAALTEPTAVARKTDRRHRTRTVEGVRLTHNGVDYRVPGTDIVLTPVEGRHCYDLRCDGRDELAFAGTLKGAIRILRRRGAIPGEGS